MKVDPFWLKVFVSEEIAFAFVMGMSCVIYLGAIGYGLGLLEVSINGIFKFLKRRKERKSSSHED